MVVCTLAITVNATFGFAFTFTRDNPSRYGFTVSGKGGATIEQKVTTDVVPITSKDNKWIAHRFTPWLLGKEMKPKLA